MNTRWEHSISLPRRFLSNRLEVWNLYVQCQQYSGSPSVRFGLRGNPWLAYQFDNAVMLFGRWVESKLAERTEDNKPKHRPETLLGLPIKPKVVSVHTFEGMPGVQVKRGSF